MIMIVLILSVFQLFEIDNIIRKHFVKISNINIDNRLLYLVGKI